MKPACRILAILLAVLLPVTLHPEGNGSSAIGSTGVRRALLVGINLYQPEGTEAQHPDGCHGGRCDLPQFKNLEGPINDVAAMRDLLSSPKFAFDPKNIVVLTNPALPATQLPYVNLPASQTAHDALLATLRKYLVDQPSSGDTVVFYYAGHGSLRINSQGTKLAMLYNGKPNHADSTLVPSDAWTGGYDILDREMTHIFNDAVDKGIHLTVLMDSCHSGSFTRGLELGKQFTERSITYDPRDINKGPETLPNGEKMPSPSDREKNPAVIFTAAQQDQTAKEGKFADAPDNTGHHGAFTLALIRTLETLPADAPASDIYRQVRATMEGEGVDDQTPWMDSTDDRKSQPLFGGVTADSSKARAAVIGIDDGGTVLLDAGKLSDINAGSEFTALYPDSNGQHVLLRVKNLEGITHSRAEIVSPAGSKVTISQLFVLSKWVPDALDAVHFWMWPNNLSMAEIQAAVAQVQLAGVATIADAAEEPWTDMLAWNGTAWELHHAAKSSSTKLGSVLTAADLPTLQNVHGKICVNDTVTDAETKLLATAHGVSVAYKASPNSCQTFLLKNDGDWVLQHTESAAITPLGAKLRAAALKTALGKNAKLWVNLPPPHELAQQLTLHEKDSLVQGVDDAAKAEYILVGSIEGGRPQWTWFHKDEFSQGPKAALTTDHTAGCSTQSKYPVRTDWIGLSSTAAVANSSSSLNTYAARLAKLNGWLHLVGSPDNNTDADFYKLELKHVSDTSQLNMNTPDAEGDKLQMYLKSSITIREKRWIYVLDINCQGKGTLLYPRKAGGNQFPNDADTAREFPLPGTGSLHIGAPFGVETLLLISTQEPLPDPGALNFEGVARGGATRGNSSPLQQLLSSASEATRSGVTQVPTNWSIQSSNLQTVPKQP